MKIHLPKYEPGRTGGGWTFQRNFVRGAGDKATRDYEEADIYFIAGATMVSRDEVLKAKEDGKKIVLRVDNAVRNSRNKNSGMTRMKDFAEWADLVVYQSRWAQDYLDSFLNVTNKTVILNGVDTDLYYPGKPVTADTYLYSRYNRDETKGWEVARYWYSREIANAQHGFQINQPRLYIVGQFSPELVDGNFDFYQDEQYTYLGILNEHSMADLYRNCKYLIYTYFNDACSNTLIEALVSGCTVAGYSYFAETGGAPEIIGAYRRYGRDYFSIKRMVDNYLMEFEKLWKHTS